MRSIVSGAAAMRPSVVSTPAAYLLVAYAHRFNGHSSTNLANSSKIGLVDIEVIGQTEIVKKGNSGRT